MEICLYIIFSVSYISACYRNDNLVVRLLHSASIGSLVLDMSSFEPRENFYIENSGDTDISGVCCLAFSLALATESPPVC